MLRAAIFILPILACLSAKGQIQGRIVDANSGEAMEGVYISAHGYSAFSDSLGLFKIGEAFREMQIQFSRMDIGHVDLVCPKIENEWLVRLEVISVLLDPQELTSGPEEVHPDHETFLYDYAFAGDQIALLVHESGKPGASLHFIDENRNLQTGIYSELRFSSLYNDCHQRLWALGKDSACLLSTETFPEILTSIPIDSFQKTIAPCKASLGKTEFFEYAVNNMDKIIWFQVDGPSENKVRILDRIRNEERLEQMQEMGFPVGRPFGATELMRSPLSENPGQMFELFFLQHTFFAPIYLPVFTFGKEIFLFDHAKGKLKVFAGTESDYSEVPIRYYKQKGWKKEILMDDSNGNFYAIFEQNGFKRLCRINSRTGESETETEIPKAWCDKIRVRNGICYFLYREKNYEDVQRLYRLPLSASQ